MRLIWLPSLMLLTMIALPAHAENVLMGVAEQSSFSEMQDKYQPLADYLGRVIKTKVTLEPS